MTVADIVERLREQIGNEKADTFFMDETVALLAEAADKIEAQEAEITRLRATPEITDEMVFNAATNVHPDLFDRESCCTCDMCVQAHEEDKQNAVDEARAILTAALSHREKGEGGMSEYPAIHCDTCNKWHHPAVNCSTKKRRNPMPSFASSPNPMVCCDLDIGYAILADDDGQLWQVAINSGTMKKVEDLSATKEETK